MQQDTQLISQLQNGDERAFSIIYDQYSGALYTVILKMTKNSDLSKDLLQDTFISIWNKAQQYNPEKGRFYTWAYRIARHKVLNYLRSEKKLIQEDDLGVYTTEEHNELHNEINSLKGAILKLEPHHQKALELVYFNGLTHIEAHQQMDVPLGTFKSYVQQAMKALRKHYKMAMAVILTVLMIRG